MSLVKVWNRNKYDHKEKFKGEEIFIKAGEFVEMDYLEGVEFAGQFTGLPPSDHPKPEMFHKMITVDKPTAPIFQEDEAVKKVATEPEKSSDVAALVDALKNLQAPGTSNAEVNSLKEQVAKLTNMLESQVARKKPGPKPKQQKATA